MRKLYIINVDPPPKETNFVLAAPQVVSVASGENKQGMDLFLSKGVTVSGLVLQSDGITPASEVFVSINDGSTGIVGSTDEDGTFVFNGLSPNTEHELFAGDESDSIVSKVLVSPQTVAQIDGHVLILGNPSTLAIGKVTINNVPMQSAEVWFALADSEKGDVIGQNVTDQNGNYKISGLRGGQYLAYIETQGLPLIAFPAVVQDGVTNTIDFEITEGQQVNNGMRPSETVVLKDSTGKLVEGKIVVLSAAVLRLVVYVRPCLPAIRAAILRYGKLGWTLVRRSTIFRRICRTLGISLGITVAKAEKLEFEKKQRFETCQYVFETFDPKTNQYRCNYICPLTGDSPSILSKLPCHKLPIKRKIKAK